MTMLIVSYIKILKGTMVMIHYKKRIIILPLCMIILIKMYYLIININKIKTNNLSK